MAGFGANGSQSVANDRYYSKMTDLFQYDDDDDYGSFESLGLEENLLKGIHPYGAVRQRGTGDTFLSRILQQLDYGLKQTKKVTAELGNYIGDKVRACFGGTHDCDD